MEQSTTPGLYALAGLATLAVAAGFAILLTAHALHALTHRYRNRSKPMAYAADISIDISDLATEDEAHEIHALIEAAIGGWKPTITLDIREH
ncbi:hypothetical protein ACIP2X_38040 [Streptomyces sp. NPDC089424]|uniref:hypothetical protein n=1 Tax=Streptomyces sp. NPDC089424 TaxID=3365917 RepID=UPI0037F6E2E1